MAPKILSPAVATATDGRTERYNLAVNQFQEGIEIHDDAISGKLKKVKYPGFGDAEAQKDSHYLALDVEVPDGATVVTRIEGGTNRNFVDLTNDKFCVYRIKNPSSQKIEIKTEKDGQSVMKVYKLTGLTLDQDEV